MNATLPGHSRESHSPVILVFLDKEVYGKPQGAIYHGRQRNRTIDEEVEGGCSGKGGVDENGGENSKFAK